MKNKAFTLAETLLVLVIIGFLASFAISAFTNSIPDKNRMMFKKAYQTTERVAGELVNDEELYPYDRDRIGFRNTDGITWPGTNEVYGGDGGSGTIRATRATKFCKLFEKKLNVIETEETRANFCGWFYTADGIAYNAEVNNMSGGNNELTIFVDINGRDKGPNCMRTEGDNNYTKCDDNDARDMFRILVNFDGKIRVQDPLARDYLTSQDVNNN